MSSEVDVVIPSVGESVTEGSIGRWFHKDGDIVKKDEPLFELDSDKASMEVTAQEAGKLKIISSEGDVVSVGAKVATIDTSASGKAGSEDREEEEAEEPSKTKKKTAEAEEKTGSDEETQKKAYDTAYKEMSPRAGSADTAAAELQTEVDDEKIKRFPPSQRKAIRHGDLRVLEKKEKAKPVGITGEDRRPMSSLRRTIAQRLLQSQQSTATLTTFNEVDMSHLMKLRSESQKKFQDQYGIKLGFMSFFTAAVCKAIGDYPIVNEFIDGNDIVNPGKINIGIAVSTDRGLVVPVLRNADKLSYAEIEKQVQALADKARDGKLSIAEMQGGTFTLTNGGIFGSLLSTPILNPPQSGILGMHKIEQRPIAVDKGDKNFEVAVRPMMYLALSYDHRLVDGKTSVSFLVSVKEYLEQVSEKEVFA